MEPSSPDDPITVDVIVIGGGLSGGLPAAAYLQKAGLQVLVVEANAELGSFCCSHETWPQTLDSPHVGVSFAGEFYTPTRVFSGRGVAGQAGARAAGLAAGNRGNVELARLAIGA
jgi:phytoene dehydrogenase-like protein